MHIIHALRQRMFVVRPSMNTILLTSRSQLKVRNNLKYCTETPILQSALVIGLS